MKSKQTYMTLLNTKQGGLEGVSLYYSKPIWVAEMKFLELSFMSKNFKVSM